MAMASSSSHAAALKKYDVFINYRIQKGDEVWTELLKTMLLLFPYHVDPSHVRKQTGSYGTALAKHKKQGNDDMMIQIWKKALFIAWFYEYLR
ncbi:hypothetical protein MTR_8g016490 [Medicago truncatula]|uniref:TIR domain-containing protein n=1 Tax=Medicago truncatula TaxID=3880 RepID=G7ZVE8_MEDTR|nr:hypothetical protein MTR_8g016490 [Medicago truncatula]